MREDDGNTALTAALRRLAVHIEVPPSDPARDAALLGRALRGAFDAHARGTPSAPRGSAWWITGLAGAAALLIAFGIPLGTAGRHGVAPPPDPSSVAQRTSDRRDVRPLAAAGDFIPWPGAAALPPLESGELVRIDLPVSVLPTLGVAVPAAHVTAIKADVIIGQDGFARAVRFVGTN